ncbi:MAG: VTT domain-containing protein [Nibricoccus sp.]
MPDESSTKFPYRKSLLIKLAIVGSVVLLTLVVVLQFWSVKELIGLTKGGIERVKTWAQTVGPGPYFTAMAVLPAAGFPISVFTLMAGGLFGPQIGLGWTIVWALLALAVNMALTYWLARYALRPLLEKLMRKMGYDLPQVSKENHASLTLFIRITPGPPYFVQGYLLGLAEVPFVTYMWLSWVCQGGYAVAMVVFGDSLMKGNGKIVFLAVGILVGLTIAVKMMRRRMAQKKGDA